MQQSGRCISGGCQHPSQRSTALLWPVPVQPPPWPLSPLTRLPCPSLPPPPSRRPLSPLRLLWRPSPHLPPPLLPTSLAPPPRAPLVRTAAAVWDGR